MARMWLALLLVLSVVPAFAQPATSDSTRTLTLQATIVGEGLPVNDLAFNSDGTLLVSGADDLSVRLWDVTTPEPEQVAQLQGQVHQVRSVDFSPDGREIVSTGFNGIAFVWDVRSRTRAASVNGQGYPSMSDAEFAPDGSAFAVAMGVGEVWLYDAETREVVQRLPGGGLLVERLAYAPSGDWLAAGFGFPTDAVIAWDVATGDTLFTLASEGGTVHGVDIGPDGDLLALGESGGTLALYALEDDLPTTPEPLASVADAHPGGVFDVVYGPDGTWVASVGFDGAIRLWGPTTGELLAAASEGERSLYAVAVSPDGTTLAGAGESGDIWLWAVSAG
jgi:WD40 repeat protein